MFDKLVYEGFQADPRLPCGWVYRVAEAELSFLSTSGALLATTAEAVAWFRQNLTSEEFTNVSSFVGEMTGQEVQVDKNLMLNVLVLIMCNLRMLRRLCPGAGAGRGRAGR